MTRPPRFDLDPPPEAERDSPPGPLTAALVVAGGFLLGGPFGLVVAVLALVLWRRHPSWLGALVVGLLVLAVLGSLAGAWPGADSLRQSFADDRPWGAAAGLGAGVALLVAVARAARADRAPTADLPSPSTAGPLSARLAPWAPMVIVVVAAGAVSLLLAPDALTAGATEAARALRAGEGLLRGSSGHHPPLALAVAAAFPDALPAVQAVLAAATAAATVVLATRLAGRRTGLLAGALAAALPLVWDQRLPAALAGLLVAVALLLAWPDRLTVARAATVGALLVAAALARPEALVVLPVVVAWVAVWPGGRSKVAPNLVALVGTATVALVLAADAIHRRTGAWWPAAPTTALVVEGAFGAVCALAVAVAAVLAADEARLRWRAHQLSWTRHLPWLALPLLALAAWLLGPLWTRDLSFTLGPLVAAGAATRLARAVDLDGRRAANSADRAATKAGV